jgi:hypothetical protein
MISPASADSAKSSHTATTQHKINAKRITCGVVVFTGIVCGVDTAVSIE